MTVRKKTVKKSTARKMPIRRSEKAQQERELPRDKTVKRDI